MPRGNLRKRYASFLELELMFAGMGEQHLSPTERGDRKNYRHPARLKSWTWGRVLSKQIILESLAEPNLVLCEITICSRDERGRGCSPHVVLNGESLTGCLSISHTERGVMVAWLPGVSGGIGVDLVDQNSNVFSSEAMRPWFTPAEQQELETKENAQSLKYWAAKEAAFKACQQEGETFIPKSIEISQQSGNCFSARYFINNDVRHCQVEVREQDGHYSALAVTEHLSELQKNSTNQNLRHSVTI